MDFAPELEPFDDGTADEVPCTPMRTRSMTEAVIVNMINPGENNAVFVLGQVLTDCLNRLSRWLSRLTWLGGTVLIVVSFVLEDDVNPEGFYKDCDWLGTAHGVTAATSLSFSVLFGGVYVWALLRIEKNEMLPQQRWVPHITVPAYHASWWIPCVLAPTQSRQALTLTLMQTRWVLLLYATAVCWLTPFTMHLVNTRGVTLTKTQSRNEH